VIEYRVKNTLESASLTNVSLQLTFNTEHLKVEHQIVAENIPAGESSNVLIGVARNPEMRVVPASVKNVLKFTFNEDGTSYEDDF
jgi:hypothetical protein